MTVGTWKKPDRATQGGTEYKNNIESCIAVAERFVRAFAPHEQSSPNMTVRIDPGFVWDDQTQTLLEIGAQSTPTITAPTNNPRIDRVVLDPTDGTIEVVRGTESSNPIPPNIPSGKVPICRIHLTPGQTLIANEHITDERVFALSGGGGGGGGGLTEVRLYQSPGSYQFTVPQDGIYYITLVGAGGGGGGGNPYAGGGGGGGGEAITTIRRLTAGTVFNITVGSGGNGGSGSNNGQPGGDTRVDSNLIAGGGGGGKSAENDGYGGQGGHSRTATDWNSLAKVRGEDGLPGTTSAGGRGGDPGNCAGLGGDGATAGANAAAGTFGGGGGGGYGSRSGATGGSGLVIIRW